MPVRSLKTMLRKNVVLVILWMSSWVAVCGQTPKYSNEFMSIGVGARALGMSNAYVSVSDDVSAGYWNPAGLTFMKANLQVGLMHSEYFAGIAQYDYGAVAFRIDDKSSFALSFLRFGVDDIPDTSELIDADGNINYDRLRSFSASDNAFLISYGRALQEGLRIGANAKIIRRTAGSFAGAWGFGLDAAVHYRWNQWQLALVARDITSTFNAWNYDFSDSMREVLTLTGNEIPENSLEISLPRFILGSSRYFQLHESVGLLASLDWQITTDGRRNVMIKGDPFSIDPALGIELDFRQMIFLRAGLGSYQKYTLPSGKQTRSVQPNMGVGVMLGDKLTIDYALTDVGDKSVALYSNVFSLRLNISRRESSQP